MITIEQKGNTAVATVLGEFALADFAEVENLVAGAKAPMNLLFDLRNMADFTVDVAWEEIKFSKAHGSDFAKIAVLTGSQWVAWSAWLTRVISHAELDVFEDQAEAEAWLAEWNTPADEALAVPPVVELPPYGGIAPEQVQLVRSPQLAEEALAILHKADVIGFDTESKPTFRKGEESTGPHLIQLATDDRAWLFPLVAAADVAMLTTLKPLLESARVLKVGFGLKDDIKRLASKFGIECTGIVDLSVALRGIQKQDFGAKTAVAHFFGQKLQKPKKISTTNWARLPYSPGQILYAANDAQVPLRYTGNGCDAAA